MHVKRRGSERHRGLTSTIINPRSIEWNVSERCVEVTSWFVPDFNTTAHHDWYISITPDELGAMIDAAASALGSKASNQVVAALSPALTSMLRIAAECSAHMATQEKISNHSCDGQA